MGGTNSRQDSRGYLLLSKEEETASIATEVNDQAPKMFRTQKPARQNVT